LHGRFAGNSRVMRERAFNFSGELLVFLLYEL
jgi:hypothetical protein